MLTKCAAPSCSASFRRLHEGRLFRLEIDPTSDEDMPANGTAPLEEYFWLCERCCRELKLHLDAQGSVMAVPLGHSIRSRDPRDFATVSRKAGKLLRSVGMVGGYPRHLSHAN